MAKSALSIQDISHIAAGVGIDMGFNAALVERYVNEETGEGHLVITWGTREYCDAPRLRPPCEWAHSWNEEPEFMREPCILELPDTARYGTSDDLRDRFTQELLMLENA
jgi:hypothetical protein